MTDLIDRYISYLRYERNASPHTIRNYHSDLLQFRDYLQGADPEAKVDLGSIDALRIRGFLALLYEREKKKTSIARKLAAVRAFYKFLAKEGAADMLKADLGAAGLPYADAAGQVADFHALRALFITRLARANIAPAVAMRLARHSSITLTIDHYTKLDIADGRAALAKLADIPETPANHTNDHTKNHTNLALDNRPQEAEPVNTGEAADVRKIA